MASTFAQPHFTLADVVPEVCTKPERLEAGSPPSWGGSTRIGAYDGWTKVAIIVTRCALRADQLTRIYRKQGFEIQYARDASTARLALADGLVPAIIVSDDLAFIASMRSIEPKDAPKIPIHAVVESSELETVNAYMHGADMAVCVDARIRENWVQLD